MYLRTFALSSWFPTLRCKSSGKISGGGCMNPQAWGCGILTTRLWLAMWPSTTVPTPRLPRIPTEASRFCSISGKYGYLCWRPAFSFASHESTCARWFIQTVVFIDQRLFTELNVSSASAFCGASSYRRYSTRTTTRCYYSKLGTLW